MKPAMIVFLFALFIAAPAFSQTATIFVIEHAPGHDVPRSYQGMDEKTVTALLALLPNRAEIVSEQTYLVALAAVQPK